MVGSSGPRKIVSNISNAKAYFLWQNTLMANKLDTKSLSRRPSYPSLKQRTIVLLLNLAVFYGAFVIASSQWLPSGGLESVWLLSAAALWFLTLLSAPWFLPPRDSIVNGIGALSVLVTMEFVGVLQFQVELNFIRWLGVAYTAALIITSLVALFLHDRPNPTAASRLMYRMVSIFGRAEIAYTIAAMISIVGAYQANFAGMASLLMLWVLFIVAKPFEALASAIQVWRSDKTSQAVADIVGVIDRVDHPNIVRVRLATGGSWKQDNLYVAAMPDGQQRFVVALFSQPQGMEVIGTGLCVATLQEPTAMSLGHVTQSHDADRTIEFIENLSGTKDAKLVGFIVENSTIGVVNFEIAKTNALKEGDVVFARVEGNEIFYQILDAVTSEESFDQNPRGTHIVRAAQLGCYEQGKGFIKYPWLPAMNTPVFGANSMTFEQGVIGPREFPIGIVPSTNIALTANIDDLVEYHTAILGVTGTGKTELTLDIVREAVARGTKVFCVDFTGDYRQRLADLNPIFPSPTEQEAEDLETKLFDAETGAYGAGAEKKALKKAIDELRSSTTKQIEDYLTGNEDNLAILELKEITNTKASLRLTELYLSTIMDWARSHRRARQIMIVLEEAHTIVPETGGSGFDYDTQWVVGRIGQIALQGRKYGVGLLVVTQRTALVSKTILSQCNTFLTHSLIDQTSLNFLQSVYSSQHAALIPNLPNLHFLAFGKALAAERPIMLRREFDQSKKDASDKLSQPLQSPDEVVVAEANQVSTDDVS
ncbi:helicase HerA domain-containing protein [Parasphingorhabdus sp.]|uniref:ATP-binding protein n=1 Tax=Parasphingorhabdus sp. TaxID=2709688 RepID=UPI003A91525B